MEVSAAALVSTLFAGKQEALSLLAICGVANFFRK
jgi:hypothetical protein